MLLHFGPLDIDTKGLPRVFNVCVDRSCSGDGPVRVSIMLEGNQRAAVQKWAKRLGAAVTETVRPLYEGDPLARYAEAALEADGYRVCVWTRIATEAER